MSAERWAHLPGGGRGAVQPSRRARSVRGARVGIVRLVLVAVVVVLGVFVAKSLFTSLPGTGPQRGPVGNIHNTPAVRHGNPLGITGS